MTFSGNSSRSQALGIAAQFGLDISGGQSEQKWAYPEIIRSRKLGSLVLKRKFDTFKYGKDKTLTQILTFGNNPPPFGYDTLETMGLRKFHNMINVSENIKTGIITLSVRAIEPNLAAQINKAIIEELDAHQEAYNKSKTSSTKKFISERLIETEKELVNVEEQLKVFRTRNRLIDNSPALMLEEQRLNREVSVLIGVFTTLKQQLETTKIEEVKDSDYVFVLDSPSIPLIRSEPNKKNIIFFFAFLGFTLSLFIIFLLEFLASRDKTTLNKFSDAKKIFYKHFLNFVPKFK